MPSHSTSSTFRSTPSVLSVATTATTSSTTPLRKSPSSSPPPPKDYSAAFGTLQSQYGWGPAVAPVPVRSPKHPREKKSEKKTERRRVESQPPQVEEKRPDGSKDFEGAFGALSSQFGFGGSWIIRTPKRPSKDRRS